MFFRRGLYLSFLALAAGFCLAADAAELNQESVAGRFKEYKTGCFELLDCSTGKVFRYNPEQCATRLAPMSTFKLFNALAGLDSGVLKGAAHKMKWDGEKRWVDDWNRDQTLATAMRDSCLWYFQKVAEGVGEKKMKEYMQAVHYGNEDISGGLTRFWLGNTLSISADEQVNFVRRLYFDELPFSKKSMKTVKEITGVKKTAQGDLHGKTGTDMVDGRYTLGWFVGYVVHKGQPYIFAANIQGSDGARGAKAREICQQVLQEAGLL
jgi:beta-lactamase class D